ncbi:unnamed protein product, partial [Mesorhabditis spiculigera]
MVHSKSNEYKKASLHAHAVSVWGGANAGGQKEHYDGKPLTAPHTPVSGRRGISPAPKDMKELKEQKEQKDTKEDGAKSKIEGKQKQGQQKLGVMKRGVLLIDRFDIREMISFGGSAEVYKAYDRSTKKEVCVKVDIKDKARLKLEIQALAELRGTPFVPEILAYGEHTDRGFIVMRLTGKSLMELRNARKSRHFTQETLFRVGKKIVSALEAVHQAGWVHRDVKPANCCIGRLDSSRIYLLDFGISRQCKTTHGEMKKPRKMAQFRGTFKYASIDAHLKKEQGPSSDLQSLIYSMVEMGTGTLPWTAKLHGDEGRAAKAQQDIDILKMKRDQTAPKLCASFPQPFQALAKYILGLNYHSAPDYKKIQSLLDDSLPPGLTLDDWYDWELSGE